MSVQHHRHIGRILEITGDYKEALENYQSAYARCIGHKQRDRISEEIDRVKLKIKQCSDRNFEISS